LHQRACGRRGRRRRQLHGTSAGSREVAAREAAHSIVREDDQALKTVHAMCAHRYPQLRCTGGAGEVPAGVDGGEAGGRLLEPARAAG